MIYLICFCISVFFAYLARKSQRRANFILLSMLSIGVTAILAGMRDVTIGIDTQSYFENSWSKAMSMEHLGLFEYVGEYLEGSRSRFEALFGLLLGVVVRLSGDYQVFLTVVHLIIVGCVYIGAFRMKEHAAPELTLLLFYLLYFGQSLNIFRQYIAMAILFAAVADIEKGKHLRYLFFVAVAFLFHNTGIIGLAPLLVYRVLYPKNPLKDTTMFRKVLTCTAIVGGTVLFVPLVKLLIEMGILSRKYLYYFNGEENSSYKLVLLFLAVEAVAMAFFWKSFRKNNSHPDFYIFCSISFVALIILGTSINYGKRIAAYFSFLNIVSLGMMVKSQKLTENRRIVGIGVVAVVLVYWAYVYLLRNASQTMPYVPFFG